MTSPMLRERTLLLSARDVLSKADSVQPVFNDYFAETGVVHPLAAALDDLRTAVALYEDVG